MDSLLYFIKFVFFFKNCKLSSVSSGSASLRSTADDNYGFSFSAGKFKVTDMDKIKYVGLVEVDDPKKPGTTIKIFLKKNIKNLFFRI